MAIPSEQPKKKSLLKAETKPKDKTLQVASNSIRKLQELYKSAMFYMNEGSTGPDANAHDIGIYYTSRDEARKYGKLLRAKGVMVKLP